MTCIDTQAQEDTYLKKLTDCVVHLRNILERTGAQLSAHDCPKLTLMDELKRDEKHEFRGNDAHKFMMNQVVTYIYSRQNTGMTSRGEYFNSTEKDIYYSSIEKNVKKEETVTYTLKGHIGIQEFVFISFNPRTKFTARVNEKEATPKGDGIQVLRLDKVSIDDIITLSISNESKYNESFVILNHNPQK